MKTGFFKTCLIITVLFMFAMSGCSVEAMNRLLSTETDELNNQAYEMIVKGDYDEAVEVLKCVVGMDDRNDTAYNNMAWALYLKGDYDEAFDFSEKSLAIDPDTEVEYINHGNILLQISVDYEAVLNDYDMALALNPNNPNALYGKGMALDFLGRHDESCEAYSEYLLLCPDDPDGYEKLGFAYLCLDKTNDARKQANWLYDHEGCRLTGLVLKAACEYADGNLDAALGLFRDAAASDDFGYDLLDRLCGYMDSEGDLRYKMRLIEAYLDTGKNDSAAYIDLVDLYMSLEDFKGAEEATRRAIRVFPDSAELYNALGDACSSRTAYRDAIESYASAVEREPDYWLAESNLIWGMYQAGEYRECIDYCSRLESKGKSEFEIFWYPAASYDAMLEKERALEYYEKSLPFDIGDDSDTCYRIALIYFYEGNIQLADKYDKLSLGYNPGNPDALWLSNQIYLKGQPVTEQLSEFIAGCYLYRDYIPSIDEKLEAFREIDDPSLESIENLIESIVPDYDYFTFFLTGENYAAFQAQSDFGTVHYTFSDELDTAGDIHSFKIDGFAPGTALEFIELANKIENGVESALVLDLRGNTGGDMSACCEILDYLLGECVVCTLYDKDGYSSSYYSDADSAEFDKICVLVDENTASAAELLTLSLALYTDNTVIIGRNTYGKGVCQQVFDSPEYGFALYLVDTYWNVRQANIDYYGIKPNIEAISQAEYEKAIVHAVND